MGKAYFYLPAGDDTGVRKNHLKSKLMKKRSLQAKLAINKQTVVTLTGEQAEAVKGGQSLACIQSRLRSCIANCASVVNACITQTEFQTCRCV